MESKRGDVPVFDGKNFDDWKFRMESVLDDEGCLQVAKVDLVELESSYAFEDGESLQAMKRKQEAVDLLRSKDRKCKRLLIAGVSNEQLELLKGKETAAGMWQALAARHEQRTVSSRVVLTREYHKLRYKPSDEEFSTYCSKFDRLARELKETGRQIDDVDLVLEFLLTLPKEYKALVTALETLEMSRLSMDYVRSRVRDYEVSYPSSNRGGAGPSRPATSFCAFSTGRGSSRSAPYYPHNCHNCGGFGHSAARCRKPGGGAHRGAHHNHGFRGNHGRGGAGRGGFKGQQPAQQPGQDKRGGGSSGGFPGRSSYNTRGGSFRGRGAARGGRGGRGWSAGSSDTAALADQSVYNFCSSEENEVIDSIVVVDSLAAIADGMQVSDQAMLGYWENGNTAIIKFILDSGASRHLVKSNVPVSQKEALKNPVLIQIAKTGAYLKAHNKGLIFGNTMANGVKIKFDLEVLIVDDLTHNLLSISSLARKGFKVTFSNDQCFLTEGEALVAVGLREMSLYELEVSVVSLSDFSMLTQEEKVWHKRLGHLGCDNMKRLSKMVDGMQEIRGDGEKFCDICVEGKQTRLPFSGTRPRTTRPLERVHSDLCGPISPVAYNGVKYILTITDDYTHYVVVYGLKSKESKNVVECIQSYVARVSALFPRGICYFRSDNGTEFVNEELGSFFAEKGIVFELTIPGTPQNNGVAERLNRTLLDKARCLLFGSSLSKRFWIEALLTAVYLLNRSPTRAVEEPKVPAELWFGVRPNLSKLRVFGCIAFVHKSKQQLNSKFDSRSKKCILLGYCDNGYRLWSIEDKKILTARNVVFNENKSKFDDCDGNVYGNDNDDDIDFSLDQGNDVEDENDEDVDMESINEPNQEAGNSDSFVPQLEEFEEHGDAPGPRRSTRVRVRPTHLKDFVALCQISKFVDHYCDVNVPNEESCEVSCLNAIEEVNEVPLDFDSIKFRDDKSLWLAAVDEELNALAENKTWELTSLPNNKTPIKSKWVFTVKFDGDGKINRRKARLVIKGCSQKYGIDYTETYAPVAKLSTVRVFLCLANKENLLVDQLDVKCAFLHGVLKEEIYMWPPEGLLVDSHQVCKLNKTLYGLKQAPMEWNKRFDICVKGLGFKQCSADRCVYVKRTDSDVIYLLLYVDDFLIACNNRILLNEVKGKLMSEFKMRDLGAVSYFLGIRVRHTSEGMFLSQEHYLAKVLKKFKVDSSAPTKTPLETHPNLSVGDKPSIVDSKPYRSVIGSLMYSCMASRPDICVAVNLFSQYQTNATEDHWKGIKRVLRYIQGSKNWGLWFRGNSNYPLSLYVDADFANEPGRKSLSGFVIEMFGDPVLWGTRKQTSVALSSTEAEFVALATAVSELLWLRQLLGELGISIKGAIPVFEDNQACIFALKSWDVKRLKHVDIKYNFVKDLYHNKIISVKYLPSYEQKADIMTKGLPYEIFSKHRESIGMCEYRQ